MKSEILRLLKESGGYVSGQQLCDRFQVSRTAVWKVVEQLKREGYEIEAVRNKGYRLVDSPDVMSQAEILSLTDTLWAAGKVVCFTETDSTNIQARAYGEKGCAHGTLFVAERQSAGKGRRGRGWDSPAGLSIYMSILLRPEISPRHAPMLTLVMAVSVAEGIKKATGQDVRIKWPNDIVLNKKKLCGILTEMSTEIDYINYVVIGVGVNVNQEDFPEEIRDKATSLRIETGRRMKRAGIIAAIMESFENNYETFVKAEDLSGIQETYNSVLVNADCDVRVLEPGNEYNAHAIGINEKGELMVRTEDGSRKNIFAGEVSVRGIYGYV